MNEEVEDLILIQENINANKITLASKHAKDKSFKKVKSKDRTVTRIERRMNRFCDLFLSALTHFIEVETGLKETDLVSKIREIAKRVEVYKKD